jgi:hemoglobin
MSFKRSHPLWAVLVAVALALPALGQAGSPPPSLYKRLGGYDAIAAVVDDFIPRLATDKSLGRFFVGASADSQKRIRQLVVDQICSLAGGPCVYIGRPTKQAHAGLGITEADWTASVNHLVATLDKFKVPAKEKGELLAAVSGLKADIVEKP